MDPHCFALLDLAPHSIYGSGTRRTKMSCFELLDVLLGISNLQFLIHKIYLFFSFKFFQFLVIKNLDPELDPDPDQDPDPDPH
jgi:hypothetical protein